ncbi:uncharacterized protein LOC108908371 [Anoplophora glabripennis]|uniref:uncharacterized protein LOC108908371 n=1 Tax=Anoplophora glabripennis TaxID=217634 RepID=UPI00087509BC|nr:uncharacterized protein LOC108908371 [Anoplophora glabripennis]
MDEQIASASFSDLFDNNTDRSWIVTKNEKDKVKVARSTEEEIDELYRTRTDWLVKNVDEEETEQDSSDVVYKWQLHGTAMFFIRDLLNCPTIDNYFICKNIPFEDVLLCGTVVSLSRYYEKCSIVVDDGTSNITCIIKQTELAALQLSEKEKRGHIELTEALKANRNDPILKARAIMMRALKNLVKNTPSFEELKLGDIVTVIGSLSEYKNNRYIFIKSIEKEQEDSLYHIKYLEELLDLYTNRYVNS